jgi:PleD family two-component response regulator
MVYAVPSSKIEIFYWQLNSSEPNQAHTMIRTVVAVVDDMFFVSKIRATGKALGMIVKLPRTVEAFRAITNEEPPAMIVVDLHNEKMNPFDLASEIKGDERLKNIPLLGFFSHVQVELQRRAREAGYDEILPRSLFARDLANILAGELQKPDGEAAN